MPEMILDRIFLTDNYTHCSLQGACENTTGDCQQWPQAEQNKEISPMLDSQRQRSDNSGTNQGGGICLRV